jgi:branched-chain amino acid transport system permease protein
VTEFLNAAFSGIGTGSIYALIALAFTFTVASTGYFNFALESILTLGTVLTYEFVVVVGVPLWLAVLLVLLLGAVIGIIEYFLLIVPVAARSKDPAKTILMVTIGASLAIDAATQIIFGPNTYAVPSYVSPNPLYIGSVIVRPTYILNFAVLVALATLAALVLGRTNLGHRLVASQEDSLGASLLGINVPRIVVGVFAVCGAVAALAGFLIVPISFANSTVGQGLVIPAFTAMVIGGFGSFGGAIIGGLIVGLVSQVLVLYAPPPIVDPFLLGVILVILVARPEGLFGKSARVV